MKNITTILFAVTIIFSSCKKEKLNPIRNENDLEQYFPIPNGDFENWSDGLQLQNWETNSCPFCVPPFETYIVKKDLDAHHGSFAARFIFNNEYPAWAENRFSISSHPVNLYAFVKYNLNYADTVLVRIYLLHNGMNVDSGQWYGTTSSNNFSQISIPITQNTIVVDSALIHIEGSHRNGSPLNNTEFLIDDLQLQ